MSAPTPAPGDDRPREGYYPDPSIPGYVRYWNGAAWVPGTSRPAPSDGEPLAAPAGTTPAPTPAPEPAPAPEPSPAPVEETGPVFLDEEPERYADEPSAPEPATAWQADASQQGGFGGEQDRRVSWGTDPRVPAPQGERTDGTVTIRAVPPGPAKQPPTDGTVTFRRPTPQAEQPEGTMMMRALPTPQAPGTQPQPQQPQAQQPQQPQPQAGFAQQGPAHAPAPQGPAQQAAAAPARQQQAQQSQQAQQAAPLHPHAAQGTVPPAAAPGQQSPAGRPAVVPPQASAPQAPATPMTSGPGGGSPSWAQQVHQLAQPAPAAGPAGPAAGEPAEPEGPVTPWKPVASDPFLAVAQAQASARPAGIGKRLAARIVDTVVLGAVTAVAAVPLGTKAVDHIGAKVDAAKASGHQVTVWLLDGTTSVYLGIVLAVLLIGGVLYEALPTAKWGRTLGKKLCGIEVRDIEEHAPPTFGAALRRWLVYSVPGLLAIGVIGVLWCLFDRPWRQCWHDKAARTFVAG
ncbi:RDD family protein [Streptomyces sp. NPDC058067]|uniref:RDD family protein n=1 Tax=Streptomyces sp. NPDC058067 TaxID=3346324 RepID=UPI0036E847D2